MSRPSRLPELKFSSLPFERAYRFDTDWFGKSARKPVSALLATDEHHLWFGGEAEGEFDFDADLSANDFIKGLWEKDLVELFLYNEGNGRYLELNLSPAGAWWGAVFSAPRMQVAEWRPTAARAYSIRGPKKWRSALCLPWDEIRKELGGGVTHANLTAITGTPEQQFFTLSDLGQGEPDFHLPLYFQPITFA